MAKYSEQYGKLLEEIAKAGDTIALKYFRTADLQIEKKRDGSRVTQADKAVEAMARERVAASGLALDVLGEEMGGSGANAPDGARNSRSFGGFWQHMLVAEGAVEAALDWTSKPWDLAPLILIVEEAGGRSTTIGGRRTIYDGSLLSTNGKIHDEVLKLLQ